jgi:hypothetical protein
MGKGNCRSCGRELSEFEMEFYSFENEYRCQECFMYYEMGNYILWQVENVPGANIKRWKRTRGRDPKQYHPSVSTSLGQEVEFWKRLDEARQITIKQINGLLPCEGKARPA